MYASATKAIDENNRAAQPWDCLAEVRTAIAQSRTDAHEGTRTDTDSPPILRPWQSVVQAFALGDGADRDGKALMTFALGSQAFETDTLPDGRYSYTLHLRMVAYNPATDITVTHDTTRTFVRAAPIPASASLTAWEELPLDAGHWQVAIRARQRDDSSGVYTVLRDVTVDAGAALTLSDIVTGIAGAPAWTATDGGTFPINYLNGWYSGETAELFFDVHGLQGGEEFHTTVEVRPIDPKARTSIQIQSTSVATVGVTHLRRALVLDQLIPGQYRLTVTVAAGDHRAVRQRILNIVARQ
jgi:hypothetical protein